MTIGILAVTFLTPQQVHAEAPVPTGVPWSPSVERLERAWAREQHVYQRLGTFFDRADQRIANAQGLIDRARANGRDVAALQAALDAFSSAVKQGRPIYEGGSGIVASHQGFDDSGHVTDFAKAVETVQEMRAKLVEVRQILRPAVVALRQALREYRQTNRPVPTATPGA